jgi:hypothetical protein
LVEGERLMDEIVDLVFKDFELFMIELLIDVIIVILNFMIFFILDVLFVLFVFIFLVGVVLENVDGWFVFIGSVFCF